MVVHSTTKFLNGHSDGLGGVVVCTKPEQRKNLPSFRKCAERFFRPRVLADSARSRRWRFAWSSTTAAAAKSPTIFQNTKKCRRSSTPDCPIIRNTTGQTADVGLRIDDRFRNRIARERQQDAAQGARLLPGRVAGRSRDSDLASRHDDACASAKRPPQNRITDGMVRISVGMKTWTISSPISIRRWRNLVVSRQLSANN